MKPFLFLLFLAATLTFAADAAKPAATTPTEPAAKATKRAAAASVAFHRPSSGDEAEAGRSCVGLELSRLN